MTPHRLLFCYCFEMIDCMLFANLNTDEKISQKFKKKSFKSLNLNLSSIPFHAVKEFLEKCKSEFEEKWNHPKHVSVTHPFFSFSVQDFLDKAKKDFEEKWAKNPQVSPVWSNYQTLFSPIACLFLFILLPLLMS